MRVLVGSGCDNVKRPRSENGGILVDISHCYFYVITIRLDMVMLSDSIVPDGPEIEAARTSFLEYNTLGDLLS